MVHVGTDKRRIRSAELLTEGLTACMKQKDFTQISISDLQRESGVSRATFYRLFDNVQDILDYKCRSMASEIPSLYTALPPEQRENFMLFTLRYWLEHHAFLEVIFQSNRADILQRALAENAAFLKAQLPLDSLSELEFDYLSAASMGILSSLLITWVARGKKETPEQLVKVFQGFGNVSAFLFH